MKCKKKRCLRTILVVLLVLLIALCYCPHEVIRSQIVEEANCIKNGMIEIVCKRCDKVLKEEILEKTAHEFGEYTLRIKPNEYGPGLEVRSCRICLKEEEREYFCKHEVNVEEDWKYTKYAITFESGERYKHCSFCNAVMLETYDVPVLENNSIYIVGTDIKKSFTISSFTQSAVDSYDIVYTEGSKLGKNNPFVLGHRYGTLGILDQTEVGTHIYLHINGVIEIYEVIVSEYGIQNAAKSDIIGRNSGVSIWDSYDCKTLHMYTCYGENRNGRWMVLAKQIL